MIGKLYENSNLLEKSLDAAWARNEAIAQNIANDDTPNYKRKDVAFEEYLNQSLDRTKLEGNLTDKRHIAINNNDINKIQPAVTQDNSDTSMRLDGNNVDIDSEMSELAKNQIRYYTMIQLVNNGYSKIKNVISEGRR